MTSSEPKMWLWIFCPQMTLHDIPKMSQIGVNWPRNSLRVNIILKSFPSFLCREWWTWNYFNPIQYSSRFGCLPDSNSWGLFRDCWQNTMYNKGKKTFYSWDSQAMNLWHLQTYSFELRGGPFLVQKSVWRSSFSRDRLASIRFGSIRSKNLVWNQKFDILKSGAKSDLDTWS